MAIGEVFQGEKGKLNNHWTDLTNKISDKCRDGKIVPNMVTAYWVYSCCGPLFCVPGLWGSKKDFILEKLKNMINNNGIMILAKEDIWQFM